VEANEMSTAHLTDTDIRVRDAVQHQLEWDPEVDASGVGVAASDGSVTLTGFIDSYAGKLAAERAAKRVRGVRAVANDIDVRLKLPRTDADIAADAAHALTINAAVPEGIQATVRSGQVTLTGAVTWLYQRQAAEQTVRHIHGVRAILDYVTVLPRAVERDVRHRIVAALHRQANLDASQITVAVDGDTVVLDGTVATWLERECAEHAAADAPGITTVKNRILVAPPALDDDEIC
jgi:osmotically-inducible protein OsmY